MGNKIQVGDRYLYNGDHYFYVVTDVYKNKLLDINAKLMVYLSCLEKRNTAVELYLSSLKHKWFPVNKDLSLPVVTITEGMSINIMSNKSYYIYGLDDVSFWLIPVAETDPLVYIEKSKRFINRVTIDRAQRLFYTGWWRIL